MRRRALLLCLVASAAHGGARRQLRSLGFELLFETESTARSERWLKVKEPLPRADGERQPHVRANGPLRARAEPAHVEADATSSEEAPLARPASDATDAPVPPTLEKNTPLSPELLSPAYEGNATQLDHPRQLPRPLVIAFCVGAFIANGIFLVYIFWLQED